jgi:hypothetical protein
MGLAIFSHLVTLFIGAIMFIVIGLSTIQLQMIKASDLNLYPYYLYEYFYRMIRPPLLINLFYILLLIRDKNLKEALVRKINYELQHIGVPQWLSGRMMRK